MNGSQEACLGKPFEYFQFRALKSDVLSELKVDNLPFASEKELIFVHIAIDSISYLACGNFTLYDVLFSGDLEIPHQDV